VARLERRIEALERLYQQSPDEPERVSEEWRAEFREKIRRTHEKAEAGNDQRLHALWDLEEALRRRAEGRWEA
jgi:hypothetical protein